MKKILITLLLPIFFFTFVNAQSTTSQSLDLKNNLRLGSSDKSTSGEVTKLQKFLFEKGYLKVSANGYFGNLTRLAVVNFQKDNGLARVGATGPATRKKILEITSATVYTSPTVSTTTQSVNTSNQANTTNDLYDLKEMYDLNNEKIVIVQENNYKVLRIVRATKNGLVGMFDKNLKTFQSDQDKELLRLQRENEELKNASKVTNPVSTNNSQYIQPTTNINQTQQPQNINSNVSNHVQNTVPVVQEPAIISRNTITMAGQGPSDNFTAKSRIQMNSYSIRTENSKGAWLTGAKFQIIGSGLSTLEFGGRKQIITSNEVIFEGLREGIPGSGITIPLFGLTENSVTQNKNVQIKLVSLKYNNSVEDKEVTGLDLTSRQYTITNFRPYVVSRPTNQNAKSNNILNSETNVASFVVVADVEAKIKLNSFSVEVSPGGTLESLSLSQPRLTYGDGNPTNVICSIVNVTKINCTIPGGLIINNGTTKTFEVFAYMTGKMQGIATMGATFGNTLTKNDFKWIDLVTGLELTGNDIPRFLQ